VLLLVSLTEERTIYLALELDRSWTEMNGVNPPSARPIECEVVARAELTIVDGEPGFRGRGPRGNEKRWRSTRGDAGATRSMARILWELSKFSFALSHSFCRCTTF
jgi:hypothetical protein